MSSSSASSASDPADQSWDDWTEEATPAHSLFDEKFFATPEQALEYDKAVHGVDLPLLAATLGELQSWGNRSEMELSGS